MEESTDYCTGEVKRVIRIGICDDVTEQVKIQQQMLENIAHDLCLNVEVGCFQSGEDLLCEIEQKGSMDIILLDIEMGGINGVEAARLIREKDNRVILIFISFFDQYCKEMISVQPFAFLDKPVSEEQLEPVIRRALKVLGEKDEIFEYTYKKVSHKILLRKIRYFESDKREINIHSTDGIYSFYKKLDEVEVQLEKTDVKFLRINKSYLVNMNYVKEFRYEKVVMDDGKEMRIGPRYKDKVRESYFEIIRIS